MRRLQHGVDGGALVLDEPAATSSVERQIRSANGGTAARAVCWCSARHGEEREHGRAVARRAPRLQAGRLVSLTGGIGTLSGGAVCGPRARTGQRRQQRGVQRRGRGDVERGRVPAHGERGLNGRERYAGVQLGDVELRASGDVLIASGAATRRGRRREHHGRQQQHCLGGVLTLGRGREHGIDGRRRGRSHERRGFGDV